MTNVPETESPAWMRAVRRKLLGWYADHARPLPWRQTRDPYAVWVSEIMLQQTQVATVERYFARFLARFPDLPSLARAEEQDVLRIWEGLGYYRRARQMHMAARQIVERWGGRFPRQADDVRGLPGIGRYTAGAILSIAFDQRQAIVEANSQRLLTRLMGFQGDPRQSDGTKRLWEMAAALLPSRGAGKFNQALMELGSLVCTPHRPRCTDCPLDRLCRARALGLEQSIPVRASRPQPTRLREAAVVVCRSGKLLLMQYVSTGRWAGLWDFPRFPLTADDPPLTMQLQDKVRQITGLCVRHGQHVATIQHGVTRYRITLECHLARYVSGRIRRSADHPMQWVKPDQLDSYPLHASGRRLGRMLADRSLIPAGP